MSEGEIDVWLLDFAGSPDASSALQRWFGIDDARAARILATLPRAVRHGATLVEAEEIAATLRILGAKVELRPAARGASSKASGTELARPVRRRVAVRNENDEVLTSGEAPASASVPLGEPPASGEMSVSDPKLDLDAPLDIPAPKAPSQRPAAAAAPAPRPASVRPPKPQEASLDPLDPLTAGGEALELAVTPAQAQKEKEAATPPGRAGVDAAAVKRIEELRRAEDDPSAPQPDERVPWLSKIPPWAIRAAAITVVGALALYGLRTAGRALVQRDTPIEVATVTDEERALASAIDMDAFLAREGSRFGTERERNRRLASQLRSGGAVRVLAADLVDVEGSSVATTLVVELPSSPARRRRIMTILESHRARREVDPASVTMPPPEQRRVFVTLD